MKVISRTIGNAQTGYFMVIDMCKRMGDLLDGSHHDCDYIA